MKIYFSHSKNLDYRNLYNNLKKLKSFDFVFPHEKSEITKSSKDIIKTCSALVAEVSIQTHGVGIEIGWANSFGVPIIFIFEKGSRLSGSLNIVSEKFIEYEKFEDVLPKLKKELNSL